MSSETGGVKPFSLGGRLYRERERLWGMTDEERNFRKKFLKDQILSHSEPREVPAIYKELYNPIRRVYTKPLNAFGKAITPLLGPYIAQGVRIATGRLLMTISLIYMGAYYFKYNAHDWTRVGGFRVVPTRPATLPGEPDFPKLSDRTTGADYASNGFKKSPI